MPGCGSGAVVCSCSLLFGCHLGRRQAETPITPLSKFSRPALAPYLIAPVFMLAAVSGLSVLTLLRREFLSFLDPLVYISLTKSQLRADAKQGNSLRFTNL